MIGRMVGFLIGAAIAISGYGMLRPAPFAKYVDFTRFGLGPFGEYKTVVCWLIVGFGVAVALAALQRSSGDRRRKRVKARVYAPAELTLEAEPESRLTAEDSGKAPPEPEPVVHEPMAHEPAH